MTGEADTLAPAGAGLTEKPPTAAPRDYHPSGKESYGALMQIVRAFGFTVFFATCIVAYGVPPQHWYRLRC